MRIASAPEILRFASNDTPHPAFGHLLPAGGEKDVARGPSPREAGRGCREAAGEGSCHHRTICSNTQNELDWRGLHPRFVRGRSINRRHLPASHALIDRELPAVMNLVAQQKPD